MSKVFRFGTVAFLAVAALLSVQAASAQMMHFTLDVVIETADGQPIPAGEVCVSGEVDPICQDIPADTPTGREFRFEGLADGEHTVTVSAEPYLEAIAYPVVSGDDTVITITLEREVTPPSNLPDTGAGVTADSATTLAGMLIAGATLLGVAAAGVRRATMFRN